MNNIKKFSVAFFTFLATLFFTFSFVSAQNNDIISRYGADDSMFFFQSTPEVYSSIGFIKHWETPEKPTYYLYFWSGKFSASPIKDATVSIGSKSYTISQVDNYRLNYIFGSDYYFFEVPENIIAELSVADVESEPTLIFTHRLKRELFAKKLNDPFLSAFKEIVTLTTKDFSTYRKPKDIDYSNGRKPSNI